MAPDDTPSRSTPVRRTLRIWVIDLFIVLAFVAAIYPTLFFTRQTLRTDGTWSDLLTLAQPSIAYTGQELSKGKLPLWNPYWFAGYPHLAMPSAGVFYPTTILFGLLRFEVAVKLVVLLHCFLAGVFAYALGRNTFGRRVPALYFALATIAGDFILPAVKGGSLWTLQTLTWFSLLVLFIHRLCAKGGWGSVVGVACSVALMVFGGDTQSLAFCLWFLGPYTAALLAGRWWRERKEWRGTVLRAAACLSGILLGVALAGIQLLPSRELFAESIRAHGVALEEMRWGGRPWNTFAPFLWLEDEDDFWLVLAAARTVIALAVSGLCFSRLPAARMAAVAIVPCVLYAVMPDWFYEHVVRFLPVYNGVRAATRMSVMVWWAVAFLSAFGVAALAIRPSEAIVRSRGMAWTTLGTLTVALILPFYAHPSIPLMRIVASLVAGTGALFLLFDMTVRPGVLWKAAVVLIVAAAGMELTWKANSFLMSGNSGSYEVESDFQTFSSSRQDMDRVALIYYWSQFRHGTAVTLLTRDRGVQGYHGLNLTRYAQLFRDVADVPVALTDAAGQLRETGGFQENWLTEKILPLLDLFNVRHLVSVDFPSPLAQSLSRRGGRFTRVRYGKVIDYVNTRALPPVYPVHDVVWCQTDAAALRLMRDGLIDYGRRVTLTGQPSDLGLRPETGPEPVTITAFEPERIGVSVSLTTPAIVVFSEMYYPGWQATVDGTPREVLCVDTALRGVAVGEGAHKIELRYRPASLVRGAIMSAVSVVILVAVTAMILFRRTRRGTSQIKPA